MSDTKAEILDGLYQWAALGQLDELNFAFRLFSRRTTRQRIVLIHRSNDGKAAIVELSRWSMERPKRPAGYRAMFSKPPPIMAAERIRAYGGEGAQVARG